jgi:hypothetical protein
MSVHATAWGIRKTSWSSPPLASFHRMPLLKMMNGGSRSYRERRCALPGNHSAPMPEQGEVIEGSGRLLPDSGDPAEASWISFEWNRINARWAYVAGDPLRSIAAVELYTTLVTIMTL